MSWEVAIHAEIGDLALHLEVAGDKAPVAVIGPNGAGKTTLLRMIAGAWRPAGGAIFAGNLPAMTRTLPLVIFTALESDVRVALVFSLVLGGIAAVLLLGLRLVPGALARLRRAKVVEAPR